MGRGKENGIVVPFPNWKSDGGTPSAPDIQKEPRGGTGDELLGLQNKQPFPDGTYTSAWFDPASLARAQRLTSEPAEEVMPMPDQTDWHAKYMEEKAKEAIDARDEARVARDDAKEILARIESRLDKVEGKVEAVQSAMKEEIKSMETRLANQIALTQTSKAWQISVSYSILIALVAIVFTMGWAVFGPHSAPTPIVVNPVQKAP